MNQNPEAPDRDGPDDGVGTSKREYPHSSGDRNSRNKEDEWPDYKGGVQRDADPSGSGDGEGRR